MIKRLAHHCVILFSIVAILMEICNAQSIKQRTVIPAELEAKMQRELGKSERFSLVLHHEGLTSVAAVAERFPGLAGDKEMLDWLANSGKNPKAFDCSEECTHRVIWALALGPDIDLSIRLRAAALSSNCKAIRKVAVTELLGCHYIDQLRVYGDEIARALMVSALDEDELELIARVAASQEIRAKVLTDPRLTRNERAWLGDRTAEASLVNDFERLVVNEVESEYNIFEPAAAMMFLQSRQGRDAFSKALSSPRIIHTQEYDIALSIFLLKVWFTGHREEKIGLGFADTLEYLRTWDTLVPGERLVGFLHALERYFKEQHHMQVKFKIPYLFRGR